MLNIITIITGIISILVLIWNSCKVLNKTMLVVEELKKSVDKQSEIVENLRLNVAMHEEIIRRLEDESKG